MIILLVYSWVYGRILLNKPLSVGWMISIALDKNFFVAGLGTLPERFQCDDVEETIVQTFFRCMVNMKYNRLVRSIFVM